MEVKSFGSRTKHTTLRMTLGIMKANFSETNLRGLPCCLRRLNMIAWKASWATITAMQPMYSGWAEYPRAPESGLSRPRTRTMKIKQTPPTRRRVVL